MQVDDTLECSLGKKSDRGATLTTITWYHIPYVYDTGVLHTSNPKKSTLFF